MPSSSPRPTTGTRWWTIWACQAGKDVYVQKPASHNIFEGRKMVEAARKYNRIVQCPNGSRGQNGYAEAVDYVRQGHLGKIVMVPPSPLQPANEPWQG